MFKPVLPMPISVRSLTAFFGSRSLTFLCSLILVLWGFPAGASAQDKDTPAESQAGAAVAAGQTSPGDPSQAQDALVGDAAPAQRLVHIVPFDRGASAVKNTFAPAGAHLTYFGGPVISNVHVVIVFWGTNVDPVVTTPGTIDQFFADITSSRYYDLLTEYSTVGVTGAGIPATSSNQTLGRGQFDATVTIIPSKCPGPTTCSLLDSDIQTELTNQLAAGHLPQPVRDAHNIIETFYMIYFPPGVHINLGGAPSCAAGGFCAYHSNTASLVPYGVLPDFGPTSGCQAPHCGSGTEFQNITAVTSHEMAEAVTDPQVGSALTFGPPLAWYDHVPSPGTDLGEVADICGGQDVTVSAGANTYMVQREFSNLQGDCVFTPPIFDLSLPAAVAPGSAFNATLTVRTTAGNFTTPITGYTGTVHFTSSDATAVLPADYTFTSTDAGAHTFSFTLNTLGDQTITSTDTHSSGFNGTATTNVNTNADMVVSKSHAGNFTQGQTGSYSIVASNNGQGPTIGAVTVVDTLPAGLTAASISGTGWTCALNTLTCTRADALARGSSYPPITLVVNVAVDAPTFLVNNVAISGGGETNTANDTASDPTTVVVPPRPDLFVQKSHNGPIFGNFFQGETGATYSINVSNVGNLASSGTVTVIDSLPAGLTATALSGTGWSCTLGTLTCTRSDALASFASYPSITLTVDVALNAPATVTNVVTVSGGGEVNTANNVAQDPTTILPPPSPDMSTGSSHLGNFLQGLTGTYDIVVVNVGTGTTTAPVTVVDNLPPGLTATSMTGVGWTCNLQTVSCTRSDTIPFNSGFPDIFLTVSVANNATSGTNTVTVSGGGETNTANDTATDPTTVLPQFVDFSISVGHPTGFTQGQTGATYFVNVVNVGTIASSGLVTVTNSLPASLTPTAIGGFGWTCTLSSLTCTRSDALSPPAVFSEIIVTVNVAANAPDTVTVNAAISGGGDSNAANNNIADTSPVTKAVNIVANGISSVTVAAGQPALFTFLAVVQSTAGTATFSCSGLPTGAACSFNPPTASLVGIPVTMTVSTTARSTAFFAPDSRMRLGPRPLLAIVSLALLAICLFFLPGRKRTKRRWSAAFGVMAIILFAGCGGGGSSSFVPTPTPTPQNPNGTPAGTYSFTVSATGSNAGTAAQPFTLIVK